MILNIDIINIYMYVTIYNLRNLERCQGCDSYIPLLTKNILILMKLYNYPAVVIE